MTSTSSPRMPSTGMPMPGSRIMDHSGRHGPKPPMRMLGSIFQRHPSSDSNAPIETR